eukprot:366302-Chlamydomonas_euryale.AAC.1
MAVSGRRCAPAAATAVAPPAPAADGGRRPVRSSLPGGPACLAALPSRGIFAEADAQARVGLWWDSRSMQSAQPINEKGAAYQRKGDSPLTKRRQPTDGKGQSTDGKGTVH